MWFNRDLFQRLEQLKARHMENSEFTAKELNSVRKRITTLEQKVVDAMNREEEWKRRLVKIENDVGTLGLKERRITTLEQQVNDLMNREEEWKKRLAKIETGMFVDQMKVDGVWREEPKEDDLEPRVGDLVVSTENPTDIRKVLANGFGIQMVGKTDIKMYNRWDLVKDVMREWKVIARREDLK